MNIGCEIKSAFMTLSKNDFVKGAVVAALATALATITPALAAGAITTAVMTTAGEAGAAAGLAYLVKNLLTNSDGKMLKTEVTETKP